MDLARALRCMEVFSISKVVTLFISGAKTPPNKHRRKNGSSRIDRCRRHQHGIVQCSESNADASVKHHNVEIRFAVQGTKESTSPIEHCNQRSALFTIPLPKPCRSSKDGTRHRGRIGNSSHMPGNSSLWQATPTLTCIKS